MNENVAEKWFDLRGWPRPAFLRGRRLTQLLLAYSGGLLLAAYLDPAPLLWGWAAALLALGSALVFRANKQAAAAALFCAMLTMGCFMGAQAETKVASFPVAPGDEVSLYGQASRNSLYREEGRYSLLLNVREVNGKPWRGQIYLYYEGGPIVAQDMVAARGSVMCFTPYGNPGTFDYDAYMKRQGIAASVSCYYNGEARSLKGFAAPGGTVCDRLLLAMDEAAGDSAAFLKGVFLGDKSDLSFSQKSDLAFSGVLHAFAVSGLHVGYVVAAAVLLAGSGRRRRWQRLLLTAAFLLFYLHLTGTPASVVRASLMALAVLAAGALDEKNDPFTTISLAAFLCLIYKPLWLFDAGFQLSFVAAGGLIYLLPTMRLLLTKPGKQKKADVMSLQENMIHFMREAFAVTLAASFATMPLIGYYFYHISIIGWLISPLFVIGAGFTVLLCFIAALGAIFSTTLATVPLFAAGLVIRPLAALSSFGTNLPGAYIASGQTPLLAVALFFAALLALPFFVRRYLRPRLFIVPALLISVLFLSLSPSISRMPGGQLEVVFIDVGQGDAALIITPQGQSILIDGGGNRMARGKVGENALMPYFRYRGLKHIDLLISSHPDEDHIDGLFTVLENMTVGQLLYADVFVENNLQKRLLALAEQQGAVLTPAYAGQRFMLGAGLYLTILNPPANAYYSERDNNAACLSILFNYGSNSFLFTGDASFNELSILPQAQIVKIPHHGSKTAYDEDAYDILQAEAVVISVGRNNSYGHPAVSVVEYWQEHSTVFRTDLHGAVTIKSDGQHWKANTYW